MKKTILLLFTILTLFIGLSCIEAKEVELSDNTKEVILLDNNTGKKGDAQCDSLFGDPEKKGTLAYYLQFALDVIKYVGIVLCVVLTVVDFAKALLSEEKELYKPLAKKAFQRLMYAVCLFFLPIIVKLLLELVDVYGTCGIG